MSKKTNSVPEQFLEQLAEKILSDETVAAAFRDFQRTAANLSDAITKKVTMNFVISALNKLSHDALTQRDSESARTKRKTTEPDWSKSSNESLRHAQIRRKKMGIKISDALNDELVKRFPGYNRETETFGNTPLSKLSDFRLRQIYWRTKKSGAPIDDELSTELARRFPSYNPTTRTFKRGRIAHPETKQRAERFAQMRDTSLRTILGRYKSSGTEIPSALDAELARRFSNYDTATHSFRRVSHKKSPQTTAPHCEKPTVVHLPMYCKATENGTFNLYTANQNSGFPILTGAVAPYDLCLFDSKTNFAIVRKKKDDNIFNLYVIDITNHTVVPFSKSGLTSVGYEPHLHKIYMSRASSRKFTAISDGDITEQVYSMPMNTPQIKARTTPSNTVIINKSGNEFRCNLMQVATSDNIARQNNLLHHILHNEPVTTPEIVRKNANAIQYQNITVTIKPIKTTLDGTYNDIYINGVKFIGNHVDTQIKLLCSNTILAIHGTIVNNPKYPEIPTWMVYDTNLRSRIPEYKQKHSQYNIYANGITNTSDGTAILELSNNAKVYLETGRMKKIAQMRRFVIDNQK